MSRYWKNGSKAARYIAIVPSPFVKIAPAK